MNSFLGSVAKALHDAIQPLAQVFFTPEGVQLFLRNHGWSVNAVDRSTLPAIRASLALEDLFQTAQGLADQLQREGPDKELETAARLSQGVISIMNAIRDLATKSTTTSGSLPFPFDQAEFWEEIPVELIDELVGAYIEKQFPLLYGMMTVSGIAEHKHVIPQAAGRKPYDCRTIYWDRLGKVVSAPERLFEEVYHWNDQTTPFDHERFLGALRQFLWTVNIPARLRVAPAGLVSKYYAPGNAVTGMLSELRIPVASAGSPDHRDYLEVGLSVFPIPPGTASDKPPVGYLLSPAITGTIKDDQNAADDDPDGSTAFFLDVAGGFDVDGAFGLEVRPGSVSAEIGAGAVDASFGIGAMPKQPWVLVGTTGSHRIELGGFRFELGLHGKSADPEFTIQAGTGSGASPPKLRVVIQSSDADGFLHKILGNDPYAVDFTGMFGWSSKTGFHFSGSAGLTFAVALDLSLGGILTFKTLKIELVGSSSGPALGVGLSIEASVGPIDATVQDVGATLSLIPIASSEAAGTFGDLDLKFDFKPPSGLGIIIDAGPITGGGFIEFDVDNGRYAGVLALSLYSIQVKAIGLLDTKMPGGESGYSFLVIISVEFTPIQLGFGITLNGVGGLCGINRNFVTDALQAGLRQHSLDHILFPKDPVKNAPAIISDLRAIFPPAEGRYVFGPMLELGWGGGLNLVTVELGVILALPSPVVIAILGQLNVNLPNPDAAIVELHLDVLGIIDFGKKLFSLDATLHDSRIVVFTIYGDMAMRLNWGDQPSFALSIGGLNPHFQPPAGFPTLKRLTIALSASENFRLTIQTYFAITSNSFQLGAHAELYIGAGDFNVYGWLGFDALLIFEPFSFVVDFTAGLALRSGNSALMGISISGELSGPTPWHAKGEAHVSLLFFDIGVTVDTTWGESRQINVPHTDAWPQLHDAIANLGNWSGALPQGIPAVVTLAKPAVDTKSNVLADPSGALTMRERVCPLDQTLTKFGEAVPGPQNVFSLDAVSLGGQPVSYTKIRDKFAPAQFEQMPDQDKLSRPSFEDRDAGFSIGDGLVTVGQGFVLDLAFEDVYVDDKAPPPPSNPVLYHPSLNLQSHWALSNAAAKSALHSVAMGSYAPPVTTAALVTMSDEYFVVATTTDLTQRTDITQPTTKGEAYEALAAHLGSNPADHDQLQVLPLHELAQ